MEMQPCERTGLRLLPASPPDIIRGAQKVGVDPFGENADIARMGKQMQILCRQSRCMYSRSATSTAPLVQVADKEPVLF